ncbi:MAG: hypothetical protein K6A37_08490 [Saccharofermentans sp.]|nr:hypothetical protein [Saccharofermentans sp.]
MLGLVMRLVSFPFRLAFQNTVDNLEGFIGGIKRKDNPLFIIMSGISLLPLVTAIGIFLYSLISFIVNSGFADQVAIIKTEKFGAITQIWTSGTAGNFYIGWICMTFVIACLVFAVCGLVHQMATGDTGDKIKLIASLVAFGGFSGLFFWASTNKEQYKEFLHSLINAGDSGSDAILAIAGLASMVMAVICTLMLANFAPFRYCIINTGVYLILAPLTCLIIENIFGLILFVAVMLIMLVVMCIAGGSLSGSSSAGASYSGADNERAKKEERIAVLEKEIRDRDEAVRRHNNNEFGYGHIDPNQDPNERRRREIEQLKSEL